MAKQSVREMLIEILQSSDTPVMAQKRLERVGLHQPGDFKHRITYAGTRRSATLTTFNPEGDPNDVQVTIEAPVGSVKAYRDPFPGCTCNWCVN